jgi:ATP-dependent Clp protease ATP-binding subunit ClpX
VEELLLNTMFELPGRDDVSKVMLDGRMVLDRVNPTLVPRGSGRAPRPKRAAS